MESRWPLITKVMIINYRAFCTEYRNVLRESWLFEDRPLFDFNERSAETRGNLKIVIRHLDTPLNNVLKVCANLIGGSFFRINHADAGLGFPIGIKIVIIRVYNS